MTIRIHMDNGSANSADEVKENEPDMPKLVLDIIPKNPQIPHIPDQMNKSAVEKHITQKGKIGVDERRIGDFRRIDYLHGNNPKVKEEKFELIAQGKLNEENEHVGKNNTSGNNGNRP